MQSSAGFADDDSYSSSGVFSSPTTQCWTFKFVAGQVKTSEGMSNLNPDLADRWRSLAELHARAVLPVAGEAWFKIGQHRAVNSRGRCS